MQIAGVTKHYIAYKNFVKLSSTINYKYKPLCKNFLKMKSGRNSQGKITVAHRGGRRGYIYKQLCLNYNQLKFTSIKLWLVVRIEYDSVRSANIALLINNYLIDNCSDTSKPYKLFNNYYVYVLAGEYLKKGDILNFYDNKLQDLPTKHQWCTLKEMPTGSIFFNLAPKDTQYGAIARSAGTKCKLLRKYQDNALIILPSKKTKLISLTNYGTLGITSNIDKKFHKLYKAGNSAQRGRKPHVRGVAKNPVDHPHGGGEGKSSGGRHPVSPKGILTKGFITIRKKKKFRKKNV